MGETDSMTDHNSSAGGVGGGRPSEQRGQFGPAGHADGQQAQAQAQAQAHAQAQPPGQPGSAPYGYPGSAQAPAQQSSEAARAQVAAAWVRTTRPGTVPPGEAAVPALPPRANQPSEPSKKDRREQAKAESQAAKEAKRGVRKAAYEQKKAAREGRKQGGAAAPVAAPAPSATAPVTNQPASAAAAPQLRAPARTQSGFDVPRPGGRLPAQGRRTHVAVRATLLITTCVFALGSCGVAGLVIGKSSVAVQSGALDDKDLRRYRLTDFPTQAAATFAEEYVTLCMTYSPQTADKRRDALAHYASSGVDRDCGVSGQGSQSVREAKWDGTVEELPEYGANGRYLGIQVKLSTGRTTTLSVPVYVRDLAAGSGLRVAGNLGEMPMPSRGSAPVVGQDKEAVDQSLSDQLKSKVLPGYFKAWAASDATGLPRFTTSDATQSATTGLAGALASPEVQEVVALAPAGSENGKAVQYGPGQTVQARVTVVWGGAPAAGAKGTSPAPTVKRSYRVTVVNTAQGWFIKDIRGGVLDPTGGTADAGAAAPAVQVPEESAPAAGGATPGAPKSP
ncbi:conjugal transfer protein [Streptomyces sp. NBC_00096]|uniref:conjugal transfer protein n=1 Tax=Streptomyces sp. NBC_00096 TaxID=2975650 RepID=UPI00324A7E52